ncbi:TetR/AcrR family transcriptional regulator [Streptomyces sp. NBC_01558]|uniref:TetR/AcrR family transcriptional regulator n=1 Tax=Streptomyces sp. NBC_01558 TaxID=2975878 RepID=UPI002DDA285B|nr:TetR/AcrR family transcriptional regulator [Streptomyces sp. NBC_01558]WSD74970.1 TetR/AcrR family transcriptional regulator [Streptomyces sp. NBC_01558]
MVTRAESAAATRDALLHAASDLLDHGGPDAVTLRAVGARAGVSRGAPYGHFADKEHLLTQLAIDAWHALAEQLRRLQHDGRLTPAIRLKRALLALIEIGRERPHLYALMFHTPEGDTDALLESVSASHGHFLDMVANAVGDREVRRYAALLLSSAHGIAGMELSGHLGTEKWDTNGEELVDMLIGSLQSSAP